MINIGSEGAMSISALAPSSTSKPVGASILPHRPTINRLIGMPPEFLQHTVEQKDDVTTYLTLTKTQLSALFRQIQPWVQTTLEAFEARLMAVMEDYTR